MGTRTVFAVALSVVFLAACSSSSTPPTTTEAPPVPKVRVVATTTHIGDFVRVIGADAVELTVIGANGIDPHSYSPTAADITALATADLVLRNGVDYEQWFDAAFSNSDSSGIVVDVSRGVQLRTTTIGGRRVSDPHIWMSAVNARQMVQNITDALSNADPDNASTFGAVQRGYDSQLVVLSRDIQSTLARAPRAPLVTTHSGLGYFVDEFDLVDGGSPVAGFSTSPTFDPAEIAKVRATGARVIFGEGTVALQITSAAAAQTGTRVIAGSDILYVDSLGPAASGASSYLDMMRHNADAIARNLS